MRLHSKLLAALSLGLVACTTASTPPPPRSAVVAISAVDGGTAPLLEERAESVPTVALTLANVVKQAAPRAKTALVFGRKEAVKELESVGIDADYAGPEVWASGCIPTTTNPSYGVVVADEVPLNPWDRADSFLPYVCGTRDVLLVARAKKLLHEVGDDRHGRIFVDSNCKQPCEVYRVESGLPNRWFVTGGLPLTLYGARLGWAEPSQPRGARGVLLGNVLQVDGDDIHGVTRIRLPDAKVATAHEIDRDALRGWLTPDEIETLPKQVNGIAKVRGSFHFDGALGLGNVHGDWKRPEDAPSLFSALDFVGTLSTMSSTRFEYLLDGDRLAQLNAKDDAAWNRAADLVRANDPAPTKPLRAMYEELAKIDESLGRTVALERAIRGLDVFEKNSSSGGNNSSSGGNNSSSGGNNSSSGGGGGNSSSGGNNSSSGGNNPSSGGNNSSSGGGGGNSSSGGNNSSSGGNNPRNRAARAAAVAAIDEKVDRDHRTAAQRELVDALFGRP